MTRKAKVIWTEHEEDKLFPAFMQVFKNDPSASATKAGNLAQMVLPDNRRRNIASVVHIPMRLRTKLIAAGVLKHLIEIDPEEVDKNVLRIQQLGDERDAALNKATELQSQVNTLNAEVKHLRKLLSEVPSESQVLKTFIADIIWDVESRRRAVPGATSSEIQKVVEPPKPVERRATPRQPPSEERLRLPQVLVVGARRQLMPNYEEALEGKVDVRFWTDGNADQLIQRAKAADYIVVNNANIGHQATELIKKADAWGKTQLTVASAVSAHLDLINGWLARRARGG